MSAILFSGAIGPVPVSVIMREIHISTLGITEYPVETGAKVTDHAYIEPKKLELEFADEFAVATYNTLVRFQESRVPFTIVSGLFVYTNMLIREISADRDAEFSQVLNGRAALQEVIIVSTAHVAGSSAAKNTKNSDAATQDRTSGTVNRGDQATKTVPPDQNRSILDRGLFGARDPVFNPTGR